MKQSLLIFLSFTWGLPSTAIGILVGLVLCITGHKPENWMYCDHFSIGKDWGGVSFGFIFITNENASMHIRNHEHGHALQNCVFGPLMLFIVDIPSAIRYWYRRYITKKGGSLKKAYDDIWFEGQATKLGTELHEYLLKK